MSVRAYVLIEADQTRVNELRESLPLIELDGSRITAIDIVAGPWDLVAQVESTDFQQLGTRVTEGIAAAGGVRRTLTLLAL